MLIAVEKCYQDCANCSCWVRVDTTDMSVKDLCDIAKCPDSHSHKCKHINMTSAFKRKAFKVNK